MSDMSTGPDPAADVLLISLPPGWATWLAHTQQVLASVDPANLTVLQVAHLDVALALEADRHPQADPSHTDWRSELPGWLAEVLAAAALHHRHESRVAGQRQTGGSHG